MIEILFRAKAINRDPDGEYKTSYQNGDWVYGLVTKMWNEEFPNLPAEMTNESGISGVEVDHKTIGQYTGLKDINSKKIFEGDIVLDKYKCETFGFVGAVEYISGRTQYEIRSPKYPDYVVNIGARSGSIKIIGNIYDNPELMKEGDRQ